MARMPAASHSGQPVRWAVWARTATMRFHGGPKVDDHRWHPHSMTGTKPVAGRMDPRVTPLGLSPRERGMEAEIRTEPDHQPVADRTRALGPVD